MLHLPPSDEGGGFCEAKDGGRELHKSLHINKYTQNHSLLQSLCKTQIPQKHGRLAFLGASAILPVSSPQRLTSSATGCVSVLRPTRGSLNRKFLLC